MYVIFPVDKILEVPSARLPTRVPALPETVRYPPHIEQSDHRLKRVHITGDSEKSAGLTPLRGDPETNEQVQSNSEPPTPGSRRKIKVLKQQLSKTSEESTEGGKTKESPNSLKNEHILRNISERRRKKTDLTFNSSSANSSFKNTSKNKESFELQSRSETHLSSDGDLQLQLNTKLQLQVDYDKNSATNSQSRQGSGTQLKTNLHSQLKADSTSQPKTSFQSLLNTELKAPQSDPHLSPKKDLQSPLRLESQPRNNLHSAPNNDALQPLSAGVQSSLKNKLQSRPNLQSTSRSNLLPPANADIGKSDSLPRPSAKKKSIPRDKIIRSTSFIEQEVTLNKERLVNREKLKSNSSAESRKTTTGERKEKNLQSSDILTLSGVNAKICEIVRADRSHNRKSNLPSFDLKLNSETSQLSVLGEDTRKTRYNLGATRSASPSAHNSATSDFFEAKSRQEKKMSAESGLRSLSHPGHNESLKNYNSTTFKLIKTISEFCGQLSRLHESHSEDLQHLVENFRKKHSELRNERHPCANQMFQAWESLLQEVEVDSQLHSDVAGTFAKQVSKPLIERTFHKKIQSKKVFTHREGFEAMLTKAEDTLRKSKKEYSDAIQVHYRAQNNASLATYFDAHNAYVEQLHATNCMLKEYHDCSLPSILQELDDVYADISAIVIESILQGVETVSITANEQNRRYESLSVICRGMDPRADTLCLVKYLDPSNIPPRPASQHRFVSPSPHPNADVEHNDINQDAHLIPPLKNELVMDQLAAVSSRARLESLRKESADLERQIVCLQEGVDALLRVQQRSLESSLYNKANELQEDISVKKFDIRVAEIRLAAVKAQKELFASKEGNGSDSRERKMSNSSSGGMKTKWMKAFKSLKSSGPSAPSSSSTSKESERKPPREKAERAERTMEPPPPLLENSHILQEYTYKKITACDVCQQILRGHSRQGLKCRLCKMNVHPECQDRVPRCQPKSRLLRRQRSTSEIESKQMMLDGGEDEVDPVISYSSLIASQPTRRAKDLPPIPVPSVSTSQPNLPPFKGGPGVPSSFSTNPGRLFMFSRQNSHK